ncbi:MAG: MFS transporter [Acidimicrobiia bacterium]|nr:MFS transporter [Acidimicrobiia bacterium]
MLTRTLDATDSAAVRRHLTTLTVARLSTNAVYRFAPPFLATIARGLDVELAELGVALAISEVGGLSSPLIGRVIDRLPRRSSMVAGLVGVVGGAILAGASTGVVMFGASLLVLAVSKIVFDVALLAWIADHVPYERRGRVTGLIETSWALGLLLGVSALGLVAAATSWRWAYGTGAVGVVVMAGVLVARLEAERPAVAGAAEVAAPVGRLPRSGWFAVLGLFGLMAAAQSLFVTFGAWLEDEFGVGTAGLAAVTFGIGGLELVASTTSAARTDRWGKERSVIAGTLVMVPAALLLAATDTQLAIGLIALGIFIGAFEFSIVSAIPIGGQLVPGSPARGIGTMVACGTLGRALTAVPATRLYDRWGLSAAALLGGGFAVLAGAAMTLRLRAVRQR